MLYYFKKGKNTTENKNKKICVVYGEGVVTDPMGQKQFVKFCGEDFLLDGTPQSDRPVEVVSD